MTKVTQQCCRTCVWLELDVCTWWLSHNVPWSIVDQLSIGQYVDVEPESMRVDPPDGESCCCWEPSMAEKKLPITLHSYTIRDKQETIHERVRGLLLECVPLVEKAAPDSLLMQRIAEVLALEFDQTLGWRLPSDD